MKYPVHIEKDGDEYLVTFPNIPEAVTTIENMEQLQLEGLDALESAFEFYPESARTIPIPSKVKKVNHVVILPTTLAAKVFLYNEWLESGKNKAELARDIGVKTPNLNRLFNFKYRSKMEAIEQALAGLGKHLEINIT